MSSFEQRIRSTPDELEQMLSDSKTRSQTHAAAEGLHRVRRIWVVGTGSSLQAAMLGAAMLQDAGRSAHAVSSLQFVHNAPIVGPHDGVVVITHSGTTAYAVSARALAFSAGLQTVTIGRKGLGYGDAIDTCEVETSGTRSVAYTSALLALGLLAAQMGADEITPATLSLVPQAVRDAIETSGVESIDPPKRITSIIGSGHAAITALQGALTVRQASRGLAEGLDSERFLHGMAPALGKEDLVVALETPDPDGFTEAVAVAAQAAGIPVARLSESAPLPVTLAQIPLTIRLQVLATRFARARGADPDDVLHGPWKEPALWSLGSPVQ
jgi:glucosamine--fructose-6-phosphate aminotransferase (isomerizing)